MAFFDLKKFCFLQSKRCCFYLYKVRKHYFQAHLIKFKFKKLALFGRKHGLTPLKKNVIFWTLKSSVFQGQKRFLFSESIISSLILVNSKERKKLAFFVQNHELTPSEKCDFLDFEKLCFLQPKKFLFSLRSH